MKAQHLYAFFAILGCGGGGGNVGPLPPDAKVPPQVELTCGMPLQPKTAYRCFWADGKVRTPMLWDCQQALLRLGTYCEGEAVYYEWVGPKVLEQFRFPGTVKPWRGAWIDKGYVIRDPRTGALYPGYAPVIEF